MPTERSSLNLRKEYYRWVPVTDYWTWAILKAAETGELNTLRKVRDFTRIGSWPTIISRFHFLVQNGLLQRVDRKWVPTEKGKDLLIHLEGVRNIVRGMKTWKRVSIGILR
jgi:DNA-binding HxlR family transcriptional regulator